jgi:hypothetical protein
VLLVGLVLLVRLHAYLISTTDSTIGLYLHVANAWLHGNLPYVTAWEYKPPGFFALLALALRLSGGNATLAVQGLATLASLATAFALWRLGPRLDAKHGERAGRYAALFYVLLSTEDEAFLGDAEMFATAFVAVALLLAWRVGKVTVGRAALVGLFAGCALQMKLTALPLLLAPAVVLLVRAGPGAGQLIAGALFGAGILLPWALDAFLYAARQQLPALLDANLGATLRRAREFHRTYAPQNWGWLGAQLRILAPAIEFAPFARIGPTLAAAATTWGWLALALLSVAGTGEFFDRQFVLLEAPAALLGGFGLRTALDALRRPRAARTALVVTMLATFALHDYWQTALAARLIYERGVRGDRVFGFESYDRVLAALRALPAAHRSLLLVQQSPLMYDALGASAPTRYPYTDHLLDARLAEMAGVDGSAEFARIFASAPCVVVTGKLAEPRFDPATVALVESRLARDYRRIALIDGRNAIYALRSSQARCAP